MRITGGYLKGRILKTLPGQLTRPTPGRIREALFSILQHDLENTDVLDLFAGSGALAIEAVSRGAASAVLVEKNERAAAIIRQNLAKCELQLRLIVADYKKGSEILAGEMKKFDLIFADPPYGTVTADDLGLLLVKFSLFKPDGFLIMEHSGDYEPPQETIIKTRRFGDSAISILRYE